MEATQERKMELEQRRHIESYKEIARAMEEIEKFIVLQVAPTDLLVRVLENRLEKLAASENRILDIYGVSKKRSIEKELSGLELVKMTLEEMEERYLLMRKEAEIGGGNGTDEVVRFYGGVKNV